MPEIQILLIFPYIGRIKLLLGKEIHKDLATAMDLRKLEFRIEL